MSATSALVESANLANYSAEANSTTPKVTGSESANLTQAQFYKLITQQLLYQDPLEPTDNAQFVTQTTQMSQLTATQAMNSTTSNQQAASLLGQNVTVYDPTDKTNTTTITGNVTGAHLNGADSTITIDDQEYPISKVKSINTFTSTGEGTATTTDNSSTATDTAAVTNLIN